MTIQELKTLIAEASAAHQWGPRDVAARASAAGISIDPAAGTTFYGLSLVSNLLGVLEDLAAIGGKAVEVGLDRCRRIALIDLSVLAQPELSSEEVEAIGEQIPEAYTYLTGLLDGADPEGAERRYKQSLVGLDD